MSITTPIFIRADALYVFRSKEEAESFMEPVDVEPDERGYDSEVRLLHVVVRGRPELLRRPGSHRTNPKETTERTFPPRRTRGAWRLMKRRFAWGRISRRAAPKRAA